MTGKNHLSIGIATGILLHNELMLSNSVATLSIMDIPVSFDSYLAIMLGSLILDLDTVNSKISRKIVPIKNRYLRFFTHIFIGVGLLLLPNLFLKYIGFLILLGRCSIFKNNHREIYHNVVGIILLSLPIYYIGSVYRLNIFFPFVIGCITHLVADKIRNHTTYSMEKILVFIYASMIILYKIS